MQKQKPIISIGAPAKSINIEPMSVPPVDGVLAEIAAAKTAVVQSLNNPPYYELSICRANCKCEPCSRGDCGNCTEDAARGMARFNFWTSRL